MEFNTIFTGKNFIELEHVDSTNNYAAILMNKTNVPDGTVILAHFQEKGRGQMGNEWKSPSGQNIMTSIVYHFNHLNSNETFLLSKAASLAVFDTVSQHVKEHVSIKWPNDIYVEDEKIAGLLIENKWLGKQCTSIIGIGLNVNQRFFGEIRGTSLSNCTGITFEIQDVLNFMVSKLEKYMIQLKQGGTETFTHKYLSNLRYRGIWHQFITNEDENFTGKILNVKNNGELIILTKEGEERAFFFKEVFPVH
ncbi:MAG: biotin--[acetyl-CoA-carboxylase] ligase [Flavobacteriales bacterium]|nr:biotin--[acetyl-CoA-carboxylase] ligase [Flavobacteriales bacterium]